MQDAAEHTFTQPASEPNRSLLSEICKLLSTYMLRDARWPAGATDAARGAADIVLTRPGLSVIVSAIIGARKIFQRMTTYSKYTVAMTFRVCFTFGLLTVIYNWYAPPCSLHGRRNVDRPHLCLGTCFPL